MSYDNSVLLDAARQLEAAARRLKSACFCNEADPRREKYLSEARALLHGAEARIKN
jgi:hypothetical protein